MGGGETPRHGGLDHLQGSHHRIVSIPELEEDTVTEQLDHVALMKCRHLVRQLGKGDGDLGGDIVSRLLRQLGIAAQVGEHRGLHLTRGATTDSGQLECGLHVLELVLCGVDLGVASEEPAEEVLT